MDKTSWTYSMSVHCTPVIDTCTCGPGCRRTRGRTSASPTRLGTQPILFRGFFIDNFAIILLKCYITVFF